MELARKINLEMERCVVGATFMAPVVYIVNVAEHCAPNAGAMKVAPTTPKGINLINVGFTEYDK